MSFSPKQKQILTFPYESDYDALICDGAVRSGKTSIMSLSFVLWMMAEFNHCSFAFCGKSVGAVERNIVQPLLSIRYLQQQFQITYNRSGHVLKVQRGSRMNMVYLFGGKDESSYMLIQGITLAGVLLDEVALMPRSFVDQALARCSVAGAKFWFNCNPENPEHWFRKEWILQAQKHRALHLHFLMDDNPSLDERTRERYRSQYSGVFYQRYILGLWVVAEGLIYTMFNKDFHVVPSVPRPYEKYVMSCDYGTINPTSIGLWGKAGGKWYRMREYYYDSRKEGRQRTDEEHYTELERLADGLHVSAIIVDPSAASFIEVIRRHDRYRVEKASNSVLDGIRNVATRLQSGDIFFCDCCTDCIREFGMYRWDEKAQMDRPIKENDHSMDDVRYFVHRVYAPDLISFK